MAEDLFAKLYSGDDSDLIMPDPRPLVETERAQLMADNTLVGTGDSAVMDSVANVPKFTGGAGNYIQAFREVSDFRSDTQPVPVDVQKDIENLAAIDALEMFKSLDLIGPDGTYDEGLAPTFKKVQGTLLSMYAYMHAPPAKEEVGPLMANAMTTIADEARRGAIAQLAAIDAQLQDPNLPEDKRRELQQQALEFNDARVGANELEALADSPAHQQAFRENFTTKAFVSPFGKFNDRTLQETSERRLFNGIYGYGTEYADGKTNYTNRQARHMDRLHKAVSLVLRDRGDQQSNDRILRQLLIRGQESFRLGQLGVQVAEDVSASHLIAASSPELFEEIKNFKLRRQAREEVASLGIEVTERRVENTVNRLIKRGADTDLEQGLLTAIRSREQRINSDLNIDSIDSEKRFADQLSNVLGGVGSIFNFGVQSGAKIADEGATAVARSVNLLTQTSGDAPQAKQFEAPGSVRAVLANEAITLARARDQKASAKETLEAADRIHADELTQDSTRFGSMRTHKASIADRSEEARVLLSPDDRFFENLNVQLFSNQAQEVERLGRIFNLPGDVLQKEFDDRRERAINDGLNKTGWTGTKPEDFDRALRELNVTKRRYDRGAATTSELLQKQWAFSIATGGTAWRGVLQTFIQDPDEFSGETVLGLGLGAGGRIITQNVKASRPFEHMVQAATQRRMKKVIGEAAVVNPEAVPRMRATLERLKPTVPDEAAGRLDAIMANLDALNKKNRISLDKDGVPVNPSRVDRNILERELRSVQGVVDELGIERSNELLSDLKLAEDVEAWINTPEQMRRFRDVIRPTQGFKRVKKQMDVDISTEQLQGDIAALINRDPTVKINDLPISPLQITQKNQSLLQRMFPDKSQGLEAGGTLNSFVQYTSRWQRGVTAMRARNAVNRNNSRELAEVLRSDLKMKEERLIVAMRHANNEELPGLSQELSFVRRQKDSTRAIDDALTNDLDNPLDVSKNLAVRNADPALMATHLMEKMGEVNVWSRLRREGEGFDEFYTRFAEEIGNEPSNAAGSMLREFYNHEGPKVVDLDPTGRAVSRSWLARTKGEIKALKDKAVEQIEDPRLRQLVETQLSRKTGAITEENIADILGGFSRVKPEAALNDLKRVMGSQRAIASVVSNDEKLADLFQEVLNMDDGTGTMGGRSAQALNYSMRLNTNMASIRSKRLAEAVNDLSPEQRRVMETALVLERDFGIQKSIADLRNDPDYRGVFQAVNPDADQAIQDILTGMTDFRYSLIRQRQAAGLITDAEANRLMGPFAARQFGAHQRHRLRGFAQTRSVRERIEDIQDEVGQRQDDRELFTQRAKGKWKAAVRNRDGGIETDKTFFDEQDAKNWLIDRYGTAGGDGPNGERIQLLEPITDQDFIDLEILDPAVSNIDALNNFQLGTNRLIAIRALNRKGAAITPGEAAGLPPSQRRAYSRNALPDNEQLFGEFAGKVVAKSTLRRLDKFDEGQSIRRVLHETVAEAAREGGIVSQVGGRIWQAGIDFNQFNAQLIRSTQIALSPATMLLNAVSNVALFSTFALGNTRLWTSGRGIRNMLSSFDELRRWRLGNDISDEMRDAIDNGILDDTVLLRGDNAGVRAMEELRGKRSFMDSVRAGIDPRNDPEIKRLMDRQDEIRKRMEDDDLDGKRFDDLAAELAIVDAKLNGSSSKIIKTMARGMNFFNLMAGEVGAGRPIRGLGAVASDFYGMLDNATRVATYRQLRQDGLSVREAKNRINTFMQSYSRIPGYIRDAQRTPFANPIMSFPYEAGRIMLNMARENPALMAGYMAAGPALNSTAIAASGLDPVTTLDTMTKDGLVNGAMDMMSTAVIPVPDGGFVAAEWKGFNLPKVFMEGGPWGVQGDVDSIFDSEVNDGPLDTAANLLMKSTKAFIGNNALLGLGQATIANKDSFGRKYDSRSQAMNDQLQQFVHRSIPPWMPGAGRWDGNYDRNLVRGKKRYSDRFKSMLDVTVQNMTGVTIRQGNADAFVPGRMRGVTKQFVQAMMVATGTPPDKIPETEAILMGQGGFDEQDMLSVFMMQADSADPEAGRFEPPRLQREMEGLAGLLADPNSELSGWAENELSEMVSQHRERLEKRAGAAKTGVRDLDDFKRIIKAHREEGDMLAIFDKKSVPVRAQFIANLIRAGHPDLEGYARRFIVSDKSVRRFRNPADVQRARTLLERAIELNPAAAESPNVARLLRWIQPDGPAERMAAASERRERREEEELFRTLDALGN